MEHRQISGDEAELLFRASERMPDKYPEAESVLLELVGDGVDETRRVLDYWRNDVDLPGVRLDAEEQLQRRFFDTRRRHSGMVEGEFALPAVEGEALLTAMDALTPSPTGDDERSATQRRADGLGDLARAFLEGSETPVVGGERPHINIHVDIPAVRGISGLHETADGFVLDPYAVSQLACDASISRVFGPYSEVLDVGRKTRVIPAGLRRAVTARDRHCVAPGCDRSARWCDVHHLVSWADGGETVLVNLCLLCRYHHTQVHLGLLSLEDLELRPFAIATRERSTYGSSPCPEAEMRSNRTELKALDQPAGSRSLSRTDNRRGDHAGRLSALLGCCIPADGPGSCQLQPVVSPHVRQT